MKKELPKFRLENPLFLKSGDKHYNKQVKQIKERGFCDSEMWSLDFTISLFVLPRLQQFKKKLNAVDTSIGYTTVNVIKNGSKKYYELSKNSDDTDYKNYYSLI